MTTLSNAIKVSIQATKESSATLGHTALLNDIAQRLGFKDFRSLIATEKGSESRSKAPDSIIECEPFTMCCYSSDEFASVVTLEVTSDMLNRARKFSDSAKEIDSFIPFPTWSETPMEHRMTLASRMMMHRDGTVALDADLFDKHTSSSLSTYGEVNLEVMCHLVSGASQEDVPHVTSEYIWDAENRNLYLLSDVNDPEDWIDNVEDGLSDLIDQYHSL